MKPKEYTYEYLPIGTKVQLDGGKWLKAKQTGIVIEKLVHHVGVSVSLDNEGHPAIVFVDSNWSCKIIEIPFIGNCMDCGTHIPITDEYDYLCKDCR